MEEGKSTDFDAEEVLNENGVDPSKRGFVGAEISEKTVFDAEFVVPNAIEAFVELCEELEAKDNAEEFKGVVKPDDEVLN